MLQSKQQQSNLNLVHFGLLHRSQNSNQFIVTLKVCGHVLILLLTSCFSVLLKIIITLQSSDLKISFNFALISSNISQPKNLQRLSRTLPLHLPVATFFTCCYKSCPSHVHGVYGLYIPAAPSDEGRAAPRVFCVVSRVTRAVCS